MLSCFLTKDYKSNAGKPISFQHKMEGYVSIVSMLLVVFVAICMINLAESKVHYEPENGSRNITMGRRQPNDQLLYSENVSRTGKFLRTISTDVIYPPKNDLRKITITYFQVVDEHSNKKSGYAYQTSGGVSLGFVGFHIKSQRGEGYNFTVKIYGYNY